MADDVTLNPGGGGATVATDEIGGKHFQRLKLVHGADGINDGDVSRSNRLPVDVHGLVAPKGMLASSVALAAGASVDLDADQIANSKIGKLVSLIACATVAFKVELKTVTNNVPTGPQAVLFGLPGIPAQFPIPSKDIYMVAYSATPGFDGFRASITNLDTSNAADVYANFIYDEV